MFTLKSDILILINVFFFLLASWKDSFKKTKEAFGQINIVCNNAGVTALNEGAYWERVVDINLVII